MAYSPQQIYAILDSIGVDVVSQTSNDFLCLCPYHHNTQTPAFAVNRRTGLFNCFNGACNMSGNLERLVRNLTGRNRPETLRFISKKLVNDGMTLAEQLDEIFSGDQEWSVFPEQVVQDMVEQFWLTNDAISYMHGRGFNDETLRYFQVGFSAKKGNVVTFPVHNPSGDTCVGVVGRGIYERRFDNSKKLPRNRILFNLHRARKESNSAIVVESGFDAMRVHQCGYPNTVALLGSSISNEHVKLIERNFTEVILFIDNDKPGVKIRNTLADNLSVGILHAAADYDRLYPEQGIDGSKPKDAGDLSESQIKYMINNAISSVEYEMTKE